MDEAKDQVRDLLRVRRQVPFAANDNFGMETAESILDNFRSITGGLAIAMVVISSVGLMVGGIGVMNIMLVSVTERTREIGVRKAIGAKSSDIMWQFLIEAATLTGLGGIVGLSIGWGCHASAAFIPALLRTAVGAYRRLCRERWYRVDLRSLAGMESSAARSNRIAPIRIEPLKIVD